MVDLSDYAALRYEILEGVSALRLSAIEPCLFVVRMASSSASGSELAELKEELKGLKAQKGAELKREKGARDHELLAELNKDLDRVQAAITALSSGELQFTVSASATQSSLV